MQQIKDTLQFVLNYIGTISVFDIIDIALVAYLIYWVVKFIRDTKAQQLLKGIVLLLVLMQVSEWLNMNALNFILKNTMQLGVLAVLVVFQPELRRALEQVGRTKWKNLNLFSVESESEINSMKNMISEVCNATVELSRTRTGALIVFQRNDNLDELAKNGIALNSDITASLILNIFYSGAPLHDGAAIIKGSKLISAACVLPLSENTHISKELGTRHRAAIGTSEVTDALVLVVSEETGKISLAREGNLQRELKRDTLELVLSKYLLPVSEPIENKFKNIWKVKNR